MSPPMKETAKLFTSCFFTRPHFNLLTTVKLATCRTHSRNPNHLPPSPKMRLPPLRVSLLLSLLFSLTPASALDKPNGPPALGTYTAGDLIPIECLDRAM